MWKASRLCDRLLLRSRERKKGRQDQLLPRRPAKVNRGRRKNEIPTMGRKMDTKIRDRTIAISQSRELILTFEILGWDIRRMKLETMHMQPNSDRLNKHPSSQILQISSELGMFIPMTVQRQCPA